MYSTNSVECRYMLIIKQNNWLRMNMIQDLLHFINLAILDIVNSLLNELLYILN